MLFCAFKAGGHKRVWTNQSKRDQAKEWAIRCFDYQAGSVTAIVETQLVLRGNRITHIHADREKKEPDVVFLCVMTHDEFRQLGRDTVAERHARDAKIRASIEAMKPRVAKIIHWDDLTAKQQARFHGKNLSPDECWNWRPDPKLSRNEPKRWDAREDVAPYKAFYIGIKGSVPKGVYLRHKCDNRLCMNPNHLEPGTAHDNVQDMMDRGRHYRQVIAMKRAKRKEAYAKRKAKTSN